MTVAPPITAKELFEQMVEAPPDDTCRTCRFWEEDVNVWHDFGECLNNDVAGDNDYVVAPYAENIYFRKDYGCRFHRAKE